MAWRMQELREGDFCITDFSDSLYSEDMVVTP